MWSATGSAHMHLCCDVVIHVLDGVVHLEKCTLCADFHADPSRTQPRQNVGLEEI